MSNLKATEFRIGNLVNYLIIDELDKRKQWYEVSEIDHDDLYVLGIKDEMNQDYQPIQITEKWLLNFGFLIVETNKCVEAFRENFRYSIQQVNNSEQWFWCDGKNVITNLKYIHQLQNLYFAITGEELTIKK